MTIHSVIIAWRIPWTEEPGGLSSSPVSLSKFFSLSLSIPFCEMGITAAPASRGFKLVTVESCACSTQTAQKSLTIVIISTSLLNGSPLQYSCLENPMDGGAW